MQSLGKYEIEAEIGRGAMGVVYRARDPQIGRAVAIKTIIISGQEPEDQAGFRERFFQEARAAGRLNHPGIVTIFDIGQDPESGDPYIVMENVAGQSLSKVLGLEGGKLPLGPALHLAQEIAEALNYAHQQGVIHRDIKPGNILVTPEGHIKIADFGVARLNESEMTLPGQVMGSPAYMSPEQLRGDQVDARSDLFSLGVLLYRILTGYRPFQGNSVQTVAFKVANYEPMPVTSFESGLPGSLDAVVNRALAKNPKQRYRTASEFAAELEQLRQQMSLMGETADQLRAVASPSAGLPNATNATPTGQAPRASHPASYAARKAARQAGRFPPGFSTRRRSSLP
jgi:serine/threonine-protein kinase